MLKRKSIYYILFLSLGMSSCGKDFLNLNPETYINGENFFRNETELNQAVNGAYNQLVEIGRVNLWIFGEMRSDNTTFQYNNTDRGHEHREFVDEFLVSATGESLWQFWQQSYRGISRSNDVLENIDKIVLSDNKRKQFVGEVKFLRAFHYFNLVRQYGSVPLRKASTLSPNEAKTEQRASVEELYNFIIDDLKDAAVNLSGIQYGAIDIGRVTEGAARTMLAKVYLTQKKYDLAGTELRKVTQMGYQLHSDYAKNFNPNDKNGVESIFEIQYLGSNVGLFSDFMYRFAPHNSGSAVTNDPQSHLAVESGWNIPTKDLIRLYEANDLRKDKSIGSFTYSIPGGQTQTIPYIKKYNFGFVERGRTDVNFPVLRYADVLLMLSECINELSGPTNEALSLLNQVRSRAGLATFSTVSKEEMTTAIDKERRVELAFENHRWYDLVRSGKAVAVMRAHGVEEKSLATYLSPNSYNVTENNLILPIPQKEIDLNGFQQNPT